MKYKNYFLLSLIFLTSYSFADNINLVNETIAKDEIVSVADINRGTAEINVKEKLIQLEKDLLGIQKNNYLGILEDYIEQINKNQNEKISNLESQIKTHNQSISDINDKLDEIKNNIEFIDDGLFVINEIAQKNDAKLNEANTRFTEQVNMSQQKAEELSNSIDYNNSETRSNFNTMISFFSVITLLIVILIIYIIKKLISNNKAIEAQKKHAEEEGLTLDVKLLEILENQKNILSSSNDSEQIDHSFALKIADEITRMQRSLARTDPSVSGLKPLMKGIERIRKNFSAEGYEIVDLLNKPYIDGMNVEVISYIDDGTLQPDEKIIVKVIRPQVNYKGKLIQRAQIDVAIN